MGTLRLRLVLIIGFAVFGAALVWGNVANYKSLSALQDHGITVDGQVTYLIPKNERVEYTFFVGQTEFHGATDDGGGYGNPDYSHLSESGPISVVYLPDDPSTSIAGRAFLRSAHVVGEIALTAAATFLVAVVVLYGYFFVGGVGSVKRLRG